MSTNKRWVQHLINIQSFHFSVFVEHLEMEPLSSSWGSFNISFSFPFISQIPLHLDVNMPTAVYSTDLVVSMLHWSSRLHGCVIRSNGKFRFLLPWKLVRHFWYFLWTWDLFEQSLFAQSVTETLRGSREWAFLWSIPSNVVSENKNGPSYSIIHSQSRQIRACARRVFRLLTQQYLFLPLASSAQPCGFRCLPPTVQR